MVDALDECSTGMSDLLKLLVRDRQRSKIRWLLTSRNELAIREQLEYNKMGAHMSLELNSRHVSKAVEQFVHAKVQFLTCCKGYDPSVQELVQKHLLRNSEGTFLWVALVCRKLAKVGARKAKERLLLFPARLEPLYEQMLGLVEIQEDDEDSELCRRILCIVNVSFRPLNLEEIPILCDLRGKLTKTQDTKELVSQCGSFLTIRDGKVYLIHQSCTDFFTRGKGKRIFLRGVEDEHRRVASISLQIMSSTLKRDVMNQKLFDTFVEDVESDKIYTCLPPQIQYMCCHWIKHIGQASLSHWNELGLFDGGMIHKFFKTHFLHWLEALSWIREVEEAILGLLRLEKVLTVSGF